MSGHHLNLSVIIPTLNEERHIASTMARVGEQFPNAEIIVADGGSTDSTVTIADSLGATVVTTSAGRGHQLCTGVKQAHGDILVFLHADTLLPPTAGDIIGQFFTRNDVQIATFRLAFDQPHWFLRLSGWFTRFDSVFTRFGDQGIVIRRKCYDSLGGFPAWPLFEDVELLRRARRVTRIWTFPAAVTTSARRFQRRGIYGQQWLNTRLLLRFLAGASPNDLARSYRS